MVIQVFIMVFSKAENAKMANKKEGIV